MIRRHFEVHETAVTIIAEEEYLPIAEGSIIRSREAVERFIREDPFFRITLEPYPCPPHAPEIVRRMCEAASAAGVGPMAGVAGAIAPSPIPFSEQTPTPQEMSQADIEDVIRAFAGAAGRAYEAGFQVVEIHAAHGYLLHQFLSPISNQRTDGYGGDFAHRTRFLLAVTEAVRRVWPERLPLFVRISATDWVPGGWDVDQSVALACLLRERGVDLIDVSSGGTSPAQQIKLGPGYQVPFAARIRREAGIPTGAVGLITEPHQADAIVREGHADAVLIGRQSLRDPYWPLRAARTLDYTTEIPFQYQRGW